MLLLTCMEFQFSVHVHSCFHVLISAWKAWLWILRFWNVRVVYDVRRVRTVFSVLAKAGYWKFLLLSSDLSVGENNYLWKSEGKSLIIFFGLRSSHDYQPFPPRFYSFSIFSVSCTVTFSSSWYGVFVLGTTHPQLFFLEFWFVETEESKLKGSEDVKFGIVLFFFFWKIKRKCNLLNKYYFVQLFISENHVGYSGNGDIWRFSILKCGW